MTIPLLLLAIYAGVFAVALILSSYNGHFHPAPEAIRRVAEAVERASLAQLRSPMKWSALLTALLSLSGAFSAQSHGVPALWAALLPPIVAIASMTALFYGTRGVHRALSQSVAIYGGNLSLMHCARDGLSAVLLTGAVTFSFTLGVHAVASFELGPSHAIYLVLLSSCTISTVGMLFARAAAASALTAHQGAKDQELDPHGGSLALLVSDSVQAPLLLLSAWMTLTALGHCTLVLALPEKAENSGIWLYPHLLQLLGLFAVGFGAWVARIQDGEPEVYGWLRAGLVSSVLLIAGGWSLSSQLPAMYARSVPAALTFFFFSVGICVWMTPTSRRADTLGQNQPRFASVILLLSLVSVLFLSLTHAGKSTVSSDEANRLLVSFALAALPLGVLWAMCCRFEAVRAQIARLAFVQTASTTTRDERLDRLLGIVPLLAAIVALGALQPRVEVLEHVPSLMHTGLSVLWGAALAATGTALIARGAEAQEPKMRALIRPSTATSNASALDLEAATKVCETSIVDRTWLWVLVVLAPAAIAYLLQKTLPEASGRWAIWGMCLGLCLFGTGHAWLKHHCKDDSAAMFGTMSLVSCLAQVSLIFLVMEAA